MCIRDSILDAADRILHRGAARLTILGVGLASYSLAVDFDSVEEGIRMGAPEKFSWLFAHGIIVSLVWLYICLLYTSRCV